VCVKTTGFSKAALAYGGIWEEKKRGEATLVGEGCAGFAAPNGALWLDTLRKQQLNTCLHSPAREERPAAIAAQWRRREGLGGSREAPAGIKHSPSPFDYVL
jgi:hypothetical protein